MKPRFRRLRRASWVESPISSDEQARLVDGILNALVDETFIARYEVGFTCGHVRRYGAIVNTPVCHLGCVPSFWESWRPIHPTRTPRPDSEVVPW